MSNIIKRTKGDLKYLFKDSDKLSPKALKRKQRGKRVAAGLVLVLIQLILTILFFIQNHYIFNPSGTVSADCHAILILLLLMIFAHSLRRHIFSVKF